MARFERQLKGFGVKTLERVDKIRRSAVLELFKLVIEGTPFDTGRLRGNWQTTINSPATASIGRLDPSGAAAVAEAVANLGSLVDVIWFTNNLPYAERIEYDGWSAQAREGMVRKHVVMWRRIVESKAKFYSN